MKEINIVSLVNAKKDLSDEVFKRYISGFQLNPKIRPTEIADCAVLIDSLTNVGAKTHHFNDFFIGYSIQQISKEFDLLRIGHDFILNIELKHESTTDRIEKQLLQNAHYLKFLNLPVYNFTFVSQSNELYKLQNGHLQSANIVELLQLLKMQDVCRNINIDDLFDPIHYLVSPIEEPLSFMNDEYFLTAQQTTYKIEMMNRSYEYRKWIAIVGGPGTGKTLLTYDVAKQYLSSGYKVNLVHCRPLQEGQRILNKYFQWHIFHVNEPFEQQLCDVLIIDEAQLLTKNDVDRILQVEEKTNTKIILNYDPQYYFNGSPIIAYIEKFAKIIRFELKIIIRYNKEIHTFVNCLFDQTYDYPYNVFKSIRVQYFSDITSAQQYLNNLRKEQWTVIDVVTNMKIEQKTMTKDIIGQEFDNVAAIIDQHFFYKENLRLSYNGTNTSIEQPTKLLYQLLTRTRKKLEIVVLRNEQVLQHILQLLYTH